LNAAAALRLNFEGSFDGKFT